MIIAEATKVFVLEDSPERIVWFRQRIPQAEVLTPKSGSGDEKGKDRPKHRGTMSPLNKICCFAPTGP